MVQRSEDVTTGMKRWQKLLLVGSIALNLLVAGAIVGALVMHDGAHSAHPPRPDMIAGPLTRALSHEDRRIIGRKMRKAYQAADQAGGKDLQDGFQSLITNLQAEPFEPEAVARIMARQRGIFSERLAFGQDILLKYLAEMSREERMAYAKRLEQGVHRHWKHRSHSSDE